MKLLVFICIVLTLAACGGGGGGGGGKEDEKPKTAVDGRDEEMLQRAAEDTLYAFSIADSFLQLSKFGIHGLLHHRLEYVLSDLNLSSDCYTGFTYPLLTDNDNNLQLSSGDVLTLDSDACESNILQGFAHGRIDLEVIQFDVAPSGVVFFDLILDFDPNFVIQDAEGASIYINGRLEVSYQLDGDQETITLSQPGGSVIELMPDGITEIVSRISLEKRTPVDRHDLLDLEVDIAIESEILARELNCYSENMKLSNDAKNIDEGYFYCGGDYGEARLTKEEEIDIQLPDESKLKPTYTYEFDEIFSDAINGRVLYDVDDFAYEVTNKLLMLNSVTMVNDYANNRMLIATSSSSTLYPDSIVSYTGEAGLSLLLTLDVEPIDVAVSADGNVLYVQEADNLLRKYNLLTGELVSQLQHDQDILAFSVSPIDSELLALYTADSTAPVEGGKLSLVRQGVTVDVYDHGFFDDKRPAMIFDDDGDHLYVGSDRIYTIQVLGDEFSNVSIRPGSASESKAFFYQDEVLFQNYSYLINGMVRKANFSSQIAAISEEHSLAFTVGSDLRVCNLDNYYCFNSIQDTNVEAAYHNYQRARVSVLEDEVLLDNDSGNIYIFAVEDLGEGVISSCQPDVGEQQGAKVFRYHCGLTNVVYDSQREKVYALDANSSSFSINQVKPQIYAIDTITGLLESNDIPAGIPPLLDMAINSDQSILYLYEDGVELIYRINLQTWEAMPPIIFPLNADGERFLRVKNLVPSTIDPELMIFQVYGPSFYQNNTPSYVGFIDDELVTHDSVDISYSDSTFSPEKLFSAPISGYFYRYDSRQKIVEEYAVAVDEFKVVRSIPWGEACNPLQLFAVDTVLTVCGETVNLNDGTSSDPIDFSGLGINSDEYTSVLADSSAGFIYASARTQNSHPYNNTFIAYDINTKNVVKSGEISTLGGAENNSNYYELFFHSANGVFGLFDEGSLILIEDSFIQ